MQFKPSYLLRLNELVGLAYVQNLGLLMKRAPALYILFTTPLPVSNYLHLNDINTNELIFLQNKSVLLRSKSYLLNLLPFYYT